MTADLPICRCGTTLPRPGRTGGRPVKHCSIECRNAARRAKAADERSARPAVQKAIRLCEIDGCAKAHYGRGWCQMHYRRWSMHRDPLALLTPPFPERFWDKVYPCPMTGCWLWGGALDPAGYGRTADASGAIKLAHRVAYELTVGPIPGSRPHLDHLCRVKACVRPEHLEPVTQQENNRRQYAAWQQMNDRSA